MAERKYILSKEVAAKKLRRLALEVVENNYNEPELILIGIRDNGIVLANEISGYLKEIFTGEISVIELSLDKKRPSEITLSRSVDFNGKSILLIDDVANSGRTLLYALKPFLDYLPKKIQSMVLVERSHNTFPVHPDYVGLSISTTMQEHIYVEVDGDIVTGAYLA